MPYRIKSQQFCGEEKEVLQKVPAASAQEGVLPCSACDTQPQVMHCSHVKRWTRLKHAREETPVYCSVGLCAYHAVGEEDVDMWRCRLHRPKTQRELV